MNNVKSGDDLDDKFRGHAGSLACTLLHVFVSRQGDEITPYIKRSGNCIMSMIHNTKTFHQLTPLEFYRFHFTCGEFPTAPTHEFTNSIQINTDLQVGLASVMSRECASLWKHEWEEVLTSRRTGKCIDINQPHRDFYDNYFGNITDKKKTEIQSHLTAMYECVEQKLSLPVLFEDYKRVYNPLLEEFVDKNWSKDFFLSNHTTTRIRSSGNYDELLTKSLKNQIMDSITDHINNNTHTHITC